MSMDEALINRLWDESNALRDGFLNRRHAFAHLVAQGCAKVAEETGITYMGEGPDYHAGCAATAAAIRAKFSPVTVRITANLNEAEVWQDGELIGRVTGIGEDDKG
jgi:hypothetical protein